MGSFCRCPAVRCGDGPASSAVRTARTRNISEPRGGEHRQEPPGAEREEQGDQQRRQRGPGAEQRVEREDRPVLVGRRQPRGERVQRGHGGAEAEAERARRAQQDRVGGRRRRHRLAQHEQEHREEVRHETDLQDALQRPARGQQRGRRGPGDRQDDLRHEHQPVLGGAQVVAGRAEQDRAGGGERDERQPLDQPGPVDEDGPGARDGVDGRHPGASPHVPVHDSPGASVTTSAPDRNACGGQVMGSTASDCRRRSTGEDAVGGVDHQVPEGLVDPQAHARVLAGSVRWTTARPSASRTRSPNTVSSTAGPTARAVRKSSGRAGHVDGDGSLVAVGRHRGVACRRAPAARARRRAAEAQVRVEPDAERGRLVAGVGRGRGDREPVGGQVVARPAG